MPSVVIGSEEPNPAQQARIRAECERIDRDRQGIMQRAIRGHYSPDEIVHLAGQFESDQYGCPGDAAFAFGLLEAALPDPVPLDVNLWLLGSVDQRIILQGSDLPQQRVNDIRVKNWLLRSDYSLRLWFEPAPELAREFFTDPANLALAIERFGDNRSRDSALLSQLSDRTSPAFDRDAYAGLLMRAIRMESSFTGAEPHLIEAARLLVDPDLGNPDPETARTLLHRGGFTPYDHHGAQVDMLAAAVWRQVALAFSQSGDPAQRSYGEAVLFSGDPLILQRTANPDLPANAVFLAEWPVVFGAITQWDRIVSRIGDAYPARAVRDESTGPVETAVHYTRAGEFAGFVVLRSSGSAVLDAAALEAWARYLRPRPPQTLPAGMLAGRDLLVRMPIIEYHLSDNQADEGGRLREDGVIVATARSRHPTTDSCFH